MSSEHPSGPFPAPDPRRLEIRPIGGLQELREVLTAARLADLASRDGSAARSADSARGLAGLLAELESPVAMPRESIFARAWRAASGRRWREERARGERFVALLRDLANERERFERSVGAHLEQLAHRLDGIERAQAELRDETRRLESELAERRRSSAPGESTPP